MLLRCGGAGRWLAAVLPLSCVMLQNKDRSLYFIATRSAWAYSEVRARSTALRRPEYS